MAVKTLVDGDAQTVMATHSPVALGEVGIGNLSVVRSFNGGTAVRSPAIHLQRFIHRNPESFLAQKVLVCEGKTEMGVCRGFDIGWSSEGRPPFATVGLALADGGGSSQGEVAHAFAKLGYDVALLGDSDEPFTPSKDQLEAAGVAVFLWDGDVAVEQRLALDLPLDCVFSMLERAIDFSGLERVRGKVAALAGVSTTVLADDPREWTIAISPDELRLAVGKGAKDKGWFKRFDLGVRLATELVVPAWDGIQGTDLANKLTVLKTWIYGDGNTP